MYRSVPGEHIIPSKMGTTYVACVASLLALADQFFLALDSLCWVSDIVCGQRAFASSPSCWAARQDWFRFDRHMLLKLVLLLMASDVFLRATICALCALCRAT